MDKDDANRVDGLILAGGQSSRFGSDKATYKHEGRRLVDWVADQMRPLVSKLIVSSRHPKADLDQAIYVYDRVQNRGPLEGLVTGLLASQKEWILVCPVDMPFVTEVFFGKLLSSRAENVQAVVATDPSGSLHPLCGVFHSSIVTTIEKAINEENFRVMTWLESLRYATVEGDADCLQNLNNPLQLQGRLST